MPTKLAPYTPPDDPAYDIERLQWRKNLSDLDCRSLAYDYRVAKAKYDRGNGPEPDDCLVDGYEEYHERFGGSPHTEFLKKPKIGRSRRKRPIDRRA